MHGVLPFGTMLLMVLMTSSSLFAGNFEEGLKAAQEKDYQKAYKLWIIEADKGDPFAQFNLGIMFERGDGVPQNYEKALNWFEKSAELGYSPAQVNLGIMFLNGRGIPQNTMEALKWFQKAAEKGNAEAQYNLGNMYLMGQGVPKSLEMAYVWWSLASENGHQEAKINKDIAGENMLPNQIKEAQQKASKLKLRLGY
ncbi:MAG: sel1 repeat family protein [Deltaproteobacteria bacterium]|jgi:TPR repeat protein|nr:sel1 repeat family protein [Deltaproteobacteria bacterium]